MNIKPGQVKRTLYQSIKSVSDDLQNFVNDPKKIFPEIENYLLKKF